MTLWSQRKKPQSSAQDEVGFGWSQNEAERPENCVILVPDFTVRQNGDEPSGKTRGIEARLDEICGLAQAIGVNITEAGAVPLRRFHPGSLFGSGKIEEIAGIIRAGECGLAIVDHALSPVQQRNLEKAWDCKVLDRTGLILEIFGARARTKEGRLQVELAQLNYAKGRLVRQWTHLERQRGGAGFMGGPGETQIEADRRQIQTQIKSLERELEKVRRTRSLHRASRKKVPYPVIALAGYTNAGKSTLFNRLTGAKVMAKDMLFATLDPTLRQVVLPEGTKVIFSDTVGFISDLPTHLVAAFRATLEEVVEADLILHVRDISDPDHRAQAEDVYAILDDLGIGEGGHTRVIEVFNKIDLLETETLMQLLAVKSGKKGTKNDQAPVLVSAISGQGVDQLLDRVEALIGDDDCIFEITLNIDELHRLSWFYKNTQIFDRKDHETGAVSLKLRASPAIAGQIGEH